MWTVQNNVLGDQIDCWTRYMVLQLVTSVVVLVSTNAIVCARDERKKERKKERWRLKGKHARGIELSPIQWRPALPTGHSWRLHWRETREKGKCARATAAYVRPVNRALACPAGVSPTRAWLWLALTPDLTGLERAARSPTYNALAGWCSGRSTNKKANKCWFVRCTSILSVLALLEMSS
jgi:hypothetical protein